MLQALIPVALGGAGLLLSSFLKSGEPKCVCQCACASSGGFGDSWLVWILGGLLLAVLLSVWVLIREWRQILASRRHTPTSAAATSTETPESLLPSAPPLAIAAGTRKAITGPPVKRGLGTLS